MLTKSTKATVRSCAFIFCMAVAPLMVAGAQAGTQGANGAGTAGSGAQPATAGGVGQPGAAAGGMQQPGMGSNGAQTPGAGASTGSAYSGTSNGQIDTGYNNGGGHGSWGWLGLIGLFGLFGLRGRNHGPMVTTREEPVYETTGTRRP
jgi:hypothetical protein